MIAKVCKPGSDPHRLIHYLERTGRGGSRVIDHNLGGSTAKEWAHELRMVNDAYRRTKTLFVKHLVLSFPRGEHASDDELRATVRQLLDQMGYKETPFVAFLHTNIDNDHLHIVTTPTSWAGERVSESHERWRSVRAAREIEEKWNLQRVANPEGPFVKSPSQGEMKKAARTGQPPERAIFQTEIAAVAKESRSLAEFLRKARGRNFEVRVSLDSNGDLKGISFARDGVAFKGSELGRGFRGSRLLSFFGLRYDPATEREEILRLMAPQRVHAAAVAAPPVSSEPTWRERLSEPLRWLGDRLSQGREPSLPAEALEYLRIRELLATDLKRLRLQPATPARELLTLAGLRNELRLPPGLYDVAMIVPDRRDSSERGIQPHHVRETHYALDPNQVRACAAEAREEGGSQGFLLVRPSPAGETCIGFRDLSREQVARFRREGHEPAVLVQVGEHFDLWLRAGGHLREAEMRRLREAVETAHGLAHNSGLWVDAVRLPGSTAWVDGRRGEARLVEVREQPFSAWERWRDPEREKLHDRLEELAQKVHVPQAGHPMTASHRLEERERLSFPDGSPLQPLQRQVLSEARSSRRAEVPTLPPGSPEPLIGALRVANRDAIREALDSWPRGLDYYPHRERLIVVEGDLAGWLSAARKGFEEAHNQHVTAWKALETMAARIEPTAPVSVIRDYQAAATIYGQALQELEARDAAYSRLALAQATLDRERFGAYALGPTRFDDDKKRYRDLLREEVRLAARLGEEPPAGFRWDMGAGELRKDLREVNRQLATLDAPTSTLMERQNLYREREWGDLLLARAEAREASRGAMLPTAQQLGDATSDAAMQSYHHWRNAFADRSQVEDATARFGFTSTERIQHAAARVAEGDLSPEALRRLNAALITDPQPGRVTLPIFRPLDDPCDGVAELSRLLAAVRDGAAHEAHGRTLSPEERTWLLATSAEAVARIRQLDDFHCDRLRLPLPPQAPRGRSETEWRQAWIEHARRQGLSPALAASHLATASQIPVEGALRVAERVSMVVISMGLRAARTWLRELGRELHRQGK